MKNLLFIFFVLITLPIGAQTYDLNECPMISNIWVSDYETVSDGLVSNVLPKKGGHFGLSTTYIEQNFDEKKVEGYLADAFNGFRSDYKCTQVKEDTSLSKKCDDYSKIILTNYGHFKGLLDNQSECIVIIPFTLFSKVTKEDGDINKLIAESCFDIFVGCPIHMSILLDNKVFDYGFGVTIQDNKISVVIRGIKKGS
jgi:hypothetical protein